MSSYLGWDLIKVLTAQGIANANVVIDIGFNAKKPPKNQEKPLTNLDLPARFYRLELRMQPHPTLFSQIVNNLYATEFSRACEKFPGAKPARGLTPYDHFLAMCFGQLTYRESLRDIVACLTSKPQLLYHLGFRGRMTRTNLAYANKHRDWRLFQSVAETLMRRASRLYHGDSLDLDLPNMVFALDSSIISLALNLFPWGYYARTKQAALKLHLMLSLEGNLPAWAVLTDANVADLTMIDLIPLHPGAYTM